MEFCKSEKVGTLIIATLLDFLAARNSFVVNYQIKNNNT